MCSISMIIKRYKVFIWNFANQKNGVCDESPLKKANGGRDLENEA